MGKPNLLPESEQTQEPPVLESLSYRKMLWAFFWLGGPIGGWVFILFLEEMTWHGIWEIFWSGLVAGWVFGVIPACCTAWCGKILHLERTGKGIVAMAALGFVISALSYAWILPLLAYSELAARELWTAAFWKEWAGTTLIFGSPGAVAALILSALFLPKPLCKPF